MMELTLIRNARVFDGTEWHDSCDILIRDGKIEQIGQVEADNDCNLIDATGKLVIPGFIDLQVNGGGGVMLNDDRTVEGIRTICSAHARFGTTALLPTLITDTPEVTQEALAAGCAARMEGVPGFLGLHLEGPHLSVARKGAHEPSFIRPMEKEDMDRILAALDDLDVLMVTVAPENVTEDQVRELAAAGVLISLGHTNAPFETAIRYMNSGARCATHLFNAMSPLESRSPGLVGAALASGSLHAGIIADGFHVHPASMRIALAAKRGPGHLFVVTDAMSTIGTEVSGFTLNGRQIYRKSGRLTLADGTLAGADIDMLSSVRFLHEEIGLSLDEAIRMATVYPAQAAGVSDRKGHLREGFDADLIILQPDLTMIGTWIGGINVHQSR